MASDGRWALAAGHPLAVDEGAAILAAGGNAADAAVAVAFVQGVIDPAKCGIGGWGVATWWDGRSRCRRRIGSAGRRLEPVTVAVGGQPPDEPPRLVRHSTIVQPSSDAWRTATT